MMKKIYGDNVPPNGIMKPYWRAPYGEYGESSIMAAAKLGFKYHFGWNVDIRDTTDLPNCDKTGLVEENFDLMKSLKGPQKCESANKHAELILRFIKANEKNFNTSDNNRPKFATIVVLGHLSNYYMWGADPRGIPRLVREATAQGFSFAPLSEVFAFSGATPIEPNDTSPIASTDATFPKICVVDSSDGTANVRADSDIHAEKLTTLTNGTSVKVINKAGTWYSVEFKINQVAYGEANNRPAFISSSLLNCPW